MKRSIGHLPRRAVLAAGAGGLVAACSRKGAAPSAAAPPTTLEAAAAGPWRPPADRARDAWRHPAQSLAFWGLKPGMTVVEFWPGAGWYTDIIAPFLAATGGTLYAANIQPVSPAAQAVTQAFQRRIKASPKLYGRVEFTAFGPNSGPAAPAGSCDLALFLRNLHDWMRGGMAEKAFHDAFLALKPGGALGVEAHRAPPGGVQDVLAANGYVQEAYVQQMAKEAGFAFEAASEINANPKDGHDHPFGVWTLPPTLRTAPEGKPPDPKFDTRPYQAIGESDRMTLRFRKPL
ncbi:class I SAM-dependent methyltransferase [Phenylobacterium montanum]|uniref:Class I SAM-dependent methyltransferase n=1 Tax=Phenylobacterium montanum TaxID=2823693 RepID=A0A975FX17_9CAUL|nr:class I SAM-dependent methyltransferase [Caulobacter sp. S6]QUD86397.1 class I SAM-dependent methyltransferase [Caulobacter sp. S6]